MAGRQQPKKQGPARKKQAPRKPRALGSKPLKKTTRTSTMKELCYFNATHPAHLALPRRVGPYTVVRTTQTFSTIDTITMFGAFRTTATVPGGEWMNVACLSDVTPGLSINASNNAYITRFDQLTAYSTTYLNGFEVCPAALTVRVMNGNALQTTSGVVYAGRASTQMNISDTTRSWDTLGTQFVASQAPRPMSAAKLAMRAVQISSYPLDMTDVSDFRSLDSTINGNFTAIGATIAPVGLAPIIVFNTSGGALSLTFEVTMEWRVRFDLSDLASTTHSLHPPASQAVWDRAIGAAVSLGHGVEDVAEVAGLGSALLGGLGLLAL